MAELPARKPYPSDLTDAQWEILHEFIPDPIEGPQTNKHDRREIVNAILYQKRTGCQWRYLPHDFPPWSTVKDYFYAWRNDGTWVRILDTLRGRVRKKAGRKEAPSLAILDSQSVKTTEMARRDTVGFDGNKKVKGRKRHLVVDILGLIITVFVTAANIADGTTVPRALRESRARSERLEKMLLDGGYHSDSIEPASRETGIAVEVRDRPTEAKGFHVVPQRWVVERSFGWMNWDRRLAKDFERTIESSEAWIRINGIHVMLRRLSLPASQTASRVFRNPVEIPTLAA